MPTSPTFEFVSVGLNILPELVINEAPVSTSEVLTGDTFTGNYALPDEHHWFQSDGTIDGKIKSTGGDSLIFLGVNSYTGVTLGTSIQLFGGGQNVVYNSGGYLLGDVKIGTGDDLFANSGVVNGAISMGGGNDYLVNTSDVFGNGEIYGAVNMGSGDDVVLNSSYMRSVNLGDGDDFYGARNSDTTQQNYNDPDVYVGFVNGGSGDDTMFGGVNDDRFFGGDDSDVLNGHGGKDRLYGQDGQDILRGGTQNDRLYGGKGKDELYGGNGRDVLKGGSGEDMLDGGKGDDKLFGGSGRDVFVFSGASGADTIMDFDVTRDTIALPDALITVAIDAADAPSDLPDSESDTFVFPAFGDLDVMAFITYADGNAVLDLSAFYEAYGLTRMDGFSTNEGMSVTLIGVNEGELTGENFITPEDNFIGIIPEDLA